MLNFLEIKEKPRFYFTLILIIGVTFYFWFESRYPALNEKELDGLANQAISFLTPRPLLEIHQRMSFWQKVWTSFLNWSHSNKQGMLYGLVVGGLFFNLGKYIRIKPTLHSKWEPLIGLLIGAPLGVCVNCAAPIMVGLANSKRPILAVSLMLSSPSLNIIAISMTYSHFGLEITLTKILFTLFVILALVPLAFKFFVPKGFEFSIQLPQSFQFLQKPKPLKNIALDLLHSLSLIIGITLPLMAISGVIGALIVHTGLLDSMIGQKENLIQLITTSFFGTLLTVPITFDIILSNAFLNSGLPINLSLILLLTLGQFSIYSLFLTAKSITKSFALMLGLFIALTAPIFSFLTSQRIENKLENRSFVSIQRNSFVNPKNHLENLQLIKRTFTTIADPNLEIKTYPHKKSISSGQLIAHPLSKWGVLENFPDLRILIEPQQGTARPFALTDLNNDSWPEFIIGEQEKLRLFQWTEEGFIERKIVQPPSPSLNLITLDINGDGKTDLLSGSYFKGTFFLLNGENQWRKLKNSEEKIASAFSVADINNDGLDDFILGHSYDSHFRKNKHGRNLQVSQNFLIENQFPNFQAHSLNDPTGETLSILFSDLNHDGRWDVLIGNDFRTPSGFVLSQSPYSFKWETPPQITVPGSAMGIDTVDLNKDGLPEVLFTSSHHALWEKPNKISRLSLKEKICDSWKGQPKQFEQCLEFLSFNQNYTITKKRMNMLDSCQKLKQADNIKDCQAIITLLTAVGEKKNHLCSLLNSYPLLLSFCKTRENNQFISQNDFKKPKIQMGSNQAFLGSKDKFFQSNFELEDMKKTCWSWGGRSIDINQDGHYDFIFPNGFPGISKETPCPTKIFISKDDSFKDISLFHKGLYAHSKLLPFDFDQDGDLDLFLKGPFSPAVLLENQMAKLPSITLVLKRKNGAIAWGSKLLVRYKNGDRDIKELINGRGYSSSDYGSIHLPVGGRTIDQIIWIRESGKEVILNNLSAGNHYEIKPR